MSHAFMWLSENATATTLTADTYAKAAGTTSARLLDDFTHASNKLTFTGSYTAVFILNINTSIESDTANGEAHIACGSNGGNIDLSITADRQIATMSDTGSMSVGGLLRLSPNDFVELYIKFSKNADLTVRHLQFGLCEIPLVDPFKGSL